MSHGPYRLGRLGWIGFGAWFGSSCTYSERSASGGCTARCTSWLSHRLVLLLRSQISSVDVDPGGSSEAREEARSRVGHFALGVLESSTSKFFMHIHFGYLWPCTGCIITWCGLCAGYVSHGQNCFKGQRIEATMGSPWSGYRSHVASVGMGSWGCLELVGLIMQYHWRRKN